ncbi:MAG TPA: YHS domain-containing (seleno)protein [Puia sp.]|nr:YHS domain-containing (seleno)protein [Puia sp.]
MKRILHLVSLVLFLAVGASAQNTSSHPANCNTDASGLAIEGYDPVAYFSTGNAVEGSKEYMYTVDGATYRFVSARNRDLFKAAPAKYRPQYGGWCAYAMGAKGEKVEVDPKTFKVLDGKLYLFYNKYFNNTLKSWNKDEANLKVKADANWTKQNTK